MFFILFLTCLFLNFEFSWFVMMTSPLREPIRTLDSRLYSRFRKKESEINDTIFWNRFYFFNR